MALLLEADTLDDLMYQALTELGDHGARVDPPPRQGPCVELQAVTLVLSNPRARISRSITRGRLFSALGELSWYLAGSNQTAHIAHYVADYENYDEEGTVHGAYGPRLRSYDGVDQLREVIDLLKAKPSSRRAVIQLFGHEDWLGRHKEVPCTCVLQFLLRAGKLNLITYMRSNDAYLGLPHDIFCFTMLHELVSRAVGADLGSYAHVAGSLHIYDRNLDRAAEFLSEGWQSINPMPPMPDGDPMPAVDELLAAEAALRLKSGAVAYPADPYWADLARLYAVFASRNDAAAGIYDLKAQMHFTCYDIFIQTLIDNREE